MRVQGSEVRSVADREAVELAGGGAGVDLGVADEAFHLPGQIRGQLRVARSDRHGLTDGGTAMGKRVPGQIVASPLADGTV